MRQSRTPRSYRTGAAILGGVILLAANHAVASPRLDQLEGFRLVIDHGFTLAVVGCMIVLMTATGLRLLRPLAIRETSDVITLMSAAATGAGGIATALLVACSLLGVNAMAIGGTLLCVVVAVHRQAHDVMRLMRRAAGELQRIAGVPTLVVFLAVALAMFILALAPPTDYDSLMYHLEVPRQFLLRGSIHVPDGNQHASYVGLIHMLYLPFMAVGSPSAPALLNVFFTLGACAAAAAITDDLLESPSGKLVLLVLWGSPIIFLVGATPKVDVSAACFLLFAHVHLVRAITNREGAVGRAILGGALLGFAVGIKHLSLIYAVALAPLALYLLVGSARVPSALRRILLPAALAFVVAMLPWLAKNQVLFGAPFYPNLATEIAPAWVDDFGAAAPVRLGERTGPLREVRRAFDMTSWFLHPEVLTPEGEGALYGANPAFALLVLAPLMVRSIPAMGLIVPGILFIALLVFRSPFINLRYLIPAIVPLTIGASYVMGRVMRAVHARFLQATLFWLGVAAILAGPLSYAYIKVTRTNAVAYALGTISRRTYLRSGFEVAGHTRLVEEVNASLPRDARILMLFESRGYGIDRAVLPDNVMENWAYLHALTADACFQQSGITHIIVGGGTLEYFRRRGMDLEAMEWPRFADLVDRCLDPLFTMQGYAVYTVRDRPSMDSRR